MPPRGLVCISPMISDVGHSSCTCWPFGYLPLRKVCQAAAHFYLDYLFVVVESSSFCILCINPCQMYSLQRFSPVL